MKAVVQVGLSRTLFMCIQFSRRIQKDWLELFCVLLGATGVKGFTRCCLSIAYAGQQAFHNCGGAKLLADQLTSNLEIAT